MEQLELDEFQYKTFCEIEPSLLSSTTSLAKVRGFTIQLLFIMKNRYLTTSEICEITGKKGNYVRPYLYNMRKYGLAEKEGSFWKLTDLGRDLVKHYESNNIIIEGKRRVKEALKNSKSSTQNRHDSFCISNFLVDLGLSLSEIEKAVVEVLIEYYNKTGSKFILVSNQYELAERLNCNPSDLPNALKILREKGIIYIFKDKTFNCWKIGLKKQFLERLRIKSEKI